MGKSIGNSVVEGVSLSGLMSAFHGLNWTGKVRFMEMCVEVLRGEPKLLDEIFTIWLKVRYPGNRERADRWMESRFRKDMSLRPKVVAYECASYLGITKKMIPYLIKSAQKVKDRLRKEMGGQYLGYGNRVQRSG